MAPKKQSNKSKTKAPSDHNKVDERRKHFFRLFKAEAPFLRDKIARELPAYNLLLSMEAESFNDIALRIIAKERGVVFDPEHPPRPTCYKCKQHDKVGTKGDQGFYCSRCRKKFQATHGSIVANKNISDESFLQVLLCILDGYTIARTCELCGISSTTYYRVRNKIFYAMELLVSQASLYGNVQADCTFVKVSYKGVDLHEYEFDETTLFFDEEVFVPRSSRKRGGAYAIAERNANSICLLSFIDDRFHTRTFMCGTGLASAAVIRKHVPDGVILPTVPETDPFAKFLRKRKKPPETKPGDQTLLVTDKEAALEKYAKDIGIPHEAHVFRSKGVQRKLSKNQHDIQRVNMVHARLKRFLAEAGGISTKYLPGYLVLFDFIMMTDKNPNAVSELIEILCTPGLGRDPEFYQSRFSVPNYLEEWFSGDHPLKKLQYTQLWAFYLYDRIRNKEDYLDIEPVTMKYIMEATNYSSARIRQNYQNLLNAGYRSLILAYFGEILESKSTRGNPKAKVPPVIQKLHEEWSAYLRGEKGPRPTFAEFVRVKNEQYQLKYTEAQLRYQFKRAEELEICEALPSRDESVAASPKIPEISLTLYDEWAKLISTQNKSRPNFKQFVEDKRELYGFHYTPATIRFHFEQIQVLRLRNPLPSPRINGVKNAPSKRDALICEEYDKMVAERNQRGDTRPSNVELREVIGKKFGLLEASVANIIREVRKYQQSRLHPGPIDDRYVHASQSSNSSQAVSPRGARVSLLQYNPVTAEMWHPTKNGELTPGQVSYGSSVRVWWKCPKCEYEWESEVRRAAHKLKCVMCSRAQQAGREFATLSLVNPELARQWHPTRNGDLTPNQVTIGADRKVWWLCPDCGCEWETKVAARAGGSGCPACAKTSHVKSAGSLAETHPDLVAQWHPTKNETLTPDQITAGSRKKVWWLCKKGHEWQAQVKSRVRGNGCPICSGYAVQTGVNDLASQNPALAAEWHPTKNGNLRAHQVTRSSKKVAWWLCSQCSFEWQESISSRSKFGTCPNCAGYMATPGTNDLATLYPNIAEMWHPTKNQERPPTMFTRKAKYKVWWLCPECGHEWQARIDSMSNNPRCPNCDSE